MEYSSQHCVTLSTLIARMDINSAVVYYMAGVKQRHALKLDISTIKKQLSCSMNGLCIDVFLDNWQLSRCSVGKVYAHIILYQC